MRLILMIPAMVWLVGSALCFAFGEYLSKRFALAPSVPGVLLVLVAYNLGTLAWLPAILQKNQLSIVGAIWSVMSLLATVSIGVLIFHEFLTTVSILGILFGVLSVALLSLA